MKNCAVKLLIMTGIVSYCYADIVVQLHNQTRYELVGKIRWRNNCNQDSFSVGPYDMEVISWSNFLGLGKTCEFESLSFSALEYEAGKPVLSGSPLTGYDSPVLSRTSFFHQFKDPISVGKKGENEFGLSCKNIKLFIREVGDKSFTVEYRCFN